MSDTNQPEGVQTRLAERAASFKPELPPKLAALLPFKAQIKELRARHAAYDDIRLILAEEKIIVTLDAVYRFCRVVLGEKPRESKSNRPPKAPSSKTQPPLAASVGFAPNPSPNIQTALQERRERLPGVWGRRKRGPRIADSKNL